ncbi:MAG: hypothetical protein Q8P31_00625 [Bacillota bacterium]|nr:hypothetical protein [Bacillota bacterium]
MPDVLRVLRRSAARVRAGFVLVAIGETLRFGGFSLPGALPALAGTIGIVCDLLAVVMVWSGLEGFMSGVVAGFTPPRDEVPPDGGDDGGP